MDLPDASQLLSLPVLTYLVLVIGAQVFLALFRNWRAEVSLKDRLKAGLDEQVLVDHKVTLATIKSWAFFDAAVLLITVVGSPFLLVWLFPDQAAGLAATFLVLLLWVLITGTDVAKAFLGGVAFRAYAGLRQPFQVGDRVTLRGYAGKVEAIDPFFVRLVTLDDDLVSIPTASLWGEPLVSSNAGDRASLAVMTFHLAPFATGTQRQSAEDAIWNAIQRSVYWDFDRPMQIYLEQRRDEVVLTAKAYVASTYNEPLFKSDVYKAFLSTVDEEKIPLASTEWRRFIDGPDAPAGDGQPQSEPAG